MEKSVKKIPNNHEQKLLTIARNLFFDSISLEKVKGLSEKDKEKIKYYYDCFEQGIPLPDFFPSEEEVIKMAV